jgi:hypothetical protein
MCTYAYVLVCAHVGGCLQDSVIACALEGHMCVCTHVHSISEWKHKHPLMFLFM